MSLEIGRPDGKAEDGIFYMKWEDFIEHFSMVDILYPNKSMNNMHVTIHQEDKCYGPFLGCLFGCSRYWCMCVGLYNLWFQETSTELKKKLDSQQENLESLELGSLIS